MKWSLCLLCLVMVSLVMQVEGGCSFANQGLASSRLNDLDAAKFAAKMALAHQGGDVDILKERQKRTTEEKPYIPTFVTSERENETKDAHNEEQVGDGDIWDLSERSNKNNPRQELGKIDEEVKHGEGFPHAHTASNKIEL
eukprot:TRINITY_DN5254_c0_g1_i1.p1 TRINITY_DN5254_c0_g1~~TRINITY_DN5254_c0_g1_i1.p1  ORF type:complete len:141 (+),score=50.37 TRINITY_DN5254_c0_g1_i1:103-525(+)